MPDLLLPRLSPHAPIPATNSGQWDEKALSADELNRLANGLEVAANINRSVSIDSIPDIWARPIFFKMALYAGTDNHFDAEIHRKIKGEWRAILAMLALNTMRNLNLTVDDVHLGHGGAAVRQIEQMLLQLAPEDSVTLDTTVPILPESDWKDIYVISYRDKPLAITSPTTLVAAAADYSAELNGQLTQPWSSDGIYLTDPINYLIADELSGLKQWLQDLLNSLKNFIPFNVQTNNETCRQLFAALQSYIDEVHNRLVEFHDMTPGITIVPANFNMSIGIFRFLNNEIQPPPATPNSSFVRLIPSPSREDSSPLLIISPKMLSDISRTRAIPKPRLFVWAGLTAVDINEYSMRNNRSNIGDVSISPAQWRRPEEFFTDKLVIISGADKFKGVFNARGSESLSTQNRSIILPLKTEILEYFEPKEIAARLQIESVNGSFKVTFEFPLSGNDDSGIVYTAQKIYEAKDIVFMASALPAIEIWPNFKRRGWKKYYLYYENSEAQNQTQTVGEDFLYVYPYAYGGNIAGDNTPNRGLANRYTARLSGFPEALICTTNWTDGGRKHAKLVESGLLLLNPPQNREAYFGVNWNVGIDFGTSSTMLYKRVNDNDPQPLNLQPNLFQITESGDLRNRTYNNFIPTRTDDQQSGSFLSIFQMLGNLKSGVPIRPLQDGNIFWLLSADGPEAKHFCGNNSSINVNLKWGIAPADKMKVAAYIQQICLQILAEAAKNNVNNISWHFSYPTAFSITQSDDFISACNMSVKNALQDSGFNQGNLEKWAESQSGAYYFYHVRDTALAGGAICLDIGAGTTDISVLSGAPARIVYHSSLQFAGRYLFRSIYKNYSLFANTPMNFGKMNDHQKNSLVDADMRNHGEDYLNNLVNITDQPNVAKALQIAQFAVAGIFYYLGGLVGLLKTRRIYKEDSLPAIYVGGNGARIFSWICGNTVVDMSNARMSVFKDMFEATFGLKGIFNLFLSPTPKSEVAYGMVANIVGADPDFFNPQLIANDIFGKEGADPLIADSVFAGDSFLLDGDARSHNKTEFISAYDIQKGLQINTVDELKVFAQRFNDNHFIWDNAHGINIDDLQLNNVRLAVLGEYAKQQQRGRVAAKEIFVEPIFILELKKFMEMLC